VFYLQKRNRRFFGCSLIRDIQIVPKEYFKTLANTDWIWEVRAKHSNNAFRLLGFMDKRSLVILTNGFSRKSQKTPDQEIAFAEQRKNIYEEEKRHG
jgi:phage-related protein